MLKAFDGFDTYNSTADFVARAGWLQWTYAGLSGVTFETGRLGDGRAVVPDSTIIGTFADRLGTGFIGFGRKVAFENQSGGSPAPIVSFLDSTTGIGSGTEQLSFQFDAHNCSVSIYRGAAGGTLLWQSANNVWSIGVYNFIECGGTIHNTLGTAEVRVNGQTLVSLTGIDTQVSANAWVDQVSMIGSSPVDDFYVCDDVIGPGTYPCDTFLGDLHVFTKFPIGNSAVQWSPLSGTNWQMIDEPAMDSDTTYNFSSTPGQEDLVNFAALAGTIDHIVGIQITGAYRKDDAGPHTLKQALQSNVTKVYGATRALPDDFYTKWSDLFVLDPDTGASWTLTGVDGVAAGYNLVT